MGEDLSQGTKVAVILILLCSVIAIVFSILAIMKNITASATQDMQGTLSSVTQQKFDDYDQRVVTGAQVVAACKLFSTQDVGIIVYTNRNKTATNEDDKEPGYYCVSNLVIDGDTCRVDKTVSPTTVSVPNGFVTADYNTDIKRNDNRGVMNKATEASYVSNTARFNSYLIKTTSGDIIGILFDEV